MESKLTEFYKNLMQIVNDDANINEVSLEEQFAEIVFSYIKQEGMAFSPEYVNCENRKCSKPTETDYYKINAFDYSEETGILDVFIVNFIDKPDAFEITKNKLNIVYNAAIHFLTKTFTEAHFADDFTEDDGEMKEIVETLALEHKQKNISLIRFFVITNGIYKDGSDLLVPERFGDVDYECETYVWDMETIRRSDVASQSENAIDIDFANYYNHSIECLELEESDGVKSYLAIMPAIILARVYDEYKARLLNQNVRNYLGGKIKVNKKMKETLISTPGLFFAYNNGISSTASKVTTVNDSGKLCIVNISNWQIVNGGQTTNTIHRIYKEGKSSLDNVYITMKVSEITIKDDVQRGDAVSNIARYANSQTQIKDSDLCANISYMMNLQDLSRSEWTPTNSTRPGTKWFFERMRGQYESEAGDVKTKKYKIFTKENPKKTQCFTKTDIAKWEMSWHDAPYISSRGSELCFDAFFNTFLKTGQFEVDKKYFHELIAKAIIYQTIGQINKEIGIKAYSNIICNYVLCIISAKSKKLLDFEYVWNHQEIHPDLREYIQKASSLVNTYIEGITIKGENPTVKAKNANFWNQGIALRINGLPDFPKSLLREDTDEISEANKKLYAEFQTIRLNEWQSLSEWAKSTRNLSLVERKAIEHIVYYLDANKDITSERAINALNIMKKSKDLGFE